MKELILGVIVVVGLLSIGGALVIGQIEADTGKEIRFQNGEYTISESAEWARFKELHAH